MSDRALSIFCFGLGAGLLLAAIDTIGAPVGMDRRLLATVFMWAATLAGIIGIRHARKSP